MRPALIRLIDLGFADDFGASMSYGQSLIQAMTARRPGRPRAEIEFIRTRDIWAARVAMHAPANVLHIMAHGNSRPHTVGFWSDDRRVSLSLPRLAERLAADGEGIDAWVVLADCCDTARTRFVREMRNCLEHETVYIGATRAVNWHESTAFSSAFYSAYLKDRGHGIKALDRGLAAGERAVAAYKATMDRPCPFKVQLLSPSRTARRAFAS